VDASSTDIGGAAPSRTVATTPVHLNHYAEN